MQALDLLWDDYFRKMNDVLNPINSYIMQFQETRNKVQKRERKLVDYDKSRHNVEALRNSAKKKDDVKLTKAREELEVSTALRSLPFPPLFLSAAGATRPYAINN